MERRAPLRRRRGFSLLEVSLGMTIAVALLGTAVGVLGASDGLAAESRAALRAEQECLRDLAAVKNALRDAAWDTLSGFDAGGSSTAPSFRSVVGTATTGRVLGTTETLRWRAATVPVDGVAAPGDVVLEQGGVETVVAPRVSGGGFTVVREGSFLRVRLTTYATADGVVAEATRESAVQLRN